MRAVLAIALLTLVPAATATAAPLEVGSAPRGSVGLVALTPGGAAWIQGGLYLQADGRRIAKVGAEHPDPEGYYGTGTIPVALSVDGTTAAVSTNSYDIAKSKYTGDGTTGTAVFTVDLASGKQTPVLSCGEFGGALSDLNGGLLGLTGCASSPMTGGPLEVRPGGTLAPAAGSVRVKAPMIASREGDDVVVRDTRTGAEVQRVATHGLYDVDADGSLAYGTPAGVQLQHPGAAPVTAATGTITELRLTAGRLAYRRGDDVIVRDPDGTQRPIATGTSAGIDLDATHVAFTQDDCTRTHVRVEDVTATTPDASRIDHCPVVIAADAWTTRRGRLTVSLAVPALEPALASDRTTVAVAVRHVGHRQVRVRNGLPADVTLPASAWLRRHHPKRLRVVVRSTMRGGSDTAVRRVRVR